MGKMVNYTNNMVCIAIAAKEVHQLRKTDINKYAGSPNEREENEGAASTVKSVGKVVGKALLTVMSIFLVTGIIVGISLFSFIMTMKDEKVEDLYKMKLNYTSFIYVNGPNDDPTNPVKYEELYSSENRVWVNYADIPQHMKDAIVAIEDKRFYDHNGVDWVRTIGAVTTLFTKGSSYGGSTITQQLIKNVTGDNDVSLTRKVKEIFRALNLEKEYTKEQILEYYLNLVSFGSGTNGVQAAANRYFGKNIQDCDIAECAAIAGITKNPTANNPLRFPENNKKRQQTVLYEMYDQGKISEEEYNTAMEKSEHMVFAQQTAEEETTSTSTVPVWDWYVETLFVDVRTALMEKYDIDKDRAEDMIYHEGLNIYAAMDQDYQKIAEKVLKDGDVLPKDQKIQTGYFAMDYSGRVLAVVGARGEKEGNLLYNMATQAKRQPGSTIKPLSIYGPAVEQKLINYSTIVTDEPIQNYNNGKPGPNNFDNRYRGDVTVQYAVEISLNATAAQISKRLSPAYSFNFLQDKLGFTSLTPEDSNLSAMAVGGMNKGLTVRELVGGFQIFANGGIYNKPYTFYKITDHEGNVIIDNTQQQGSQAISSTTSSILHRLLNTVITGAEGSGRRAAISGWEVFGKTGTTNDQKDSWFVGGTPYAIAGIWTGYERPKVMTNTTYAISIWRAIMAEYLQNKEPLKFSYDSSVTSAKYCKETGKLAKEGVCTQTAVGWYSPDNMPDICDGEHANSSSEAESSEASSSQGSSLPPSSLPSSSSEQSSHSSEPSSSSSQSSGSSSGSSEGSEGGSSGSSHSRSSR